MKAERRVMALVPLLVHDSESCVRPRGDKIPARDTPFKDTYG